MVEPQEQLSVGIYVETDGTKQWPESAPPGGGINAMTKRPYRFKLTGHRVKWEVGPKPLYKIEDVKAELERIARDPSSQVPDKDKGGKKLMPCVVEAHPGVYYEDVAKTTDACREAGFTEINFGGGLGEKKK